MDTPLNIYEYTCILGGYSPPYIVLNRTQRFRDLPRYVAFYFFFRKIFFSENLLWQADSPCKITQESVEFFKIGLF